MVAHLSSKVYPDNYFSIGVVPRKRKAASEKAYDNDWSGQWNSVTYEVKRGNRKYLKEMSWLEGEVQPNSNLDSSPKSSQPRGQYGSNGITSYGKRCVKGATALLEKEYGKKRLGFGTLTIPGYSPEQIKILIKRWGDVVRVFFQKVKRHMEAIGKPYEVVGVTEIQPERYLESGLIVPHIHFVYVSRDRYNSKFYISADLFREMWKDTMVNYVGTTNSETTAAIVWGRHVHVTPIKYSAVNYIGKYMTKGGAILDDIKYNGRQDELVRQWWMACQSVKSKLKKSIKRINMSAMHILFYYPDQALERNIIRWFQEIYVEMNGEERLVGVVGYFADDASMQSCIM